MIKRRKFLTKAICFMLIMLLSMGSAVFAYADVDNALYNMDISVIDSVDLPELDKSEDGSEVCTEHENVENGYYSCYYSYCNEGDSEYNYGQSDEYYDSDYNEKKYDEELEGEELEEEKLIAPMLFSPFSTQMVVPGAAPVEPASDWASLEAVVASVASGDVVIYLTDHITGTGQDHAIMIPAGVSVWIVGNGNSIFQDSTFVQEPPIGAGSYSFQRRHFVVDGSLYFDDVALTRSAGLTHRGGGILIRDGGHVEMFAGAVISNNIGTEYTPQTANATENGGGVYLVGGNNSFIMHGGQIIGNHANHAGGGIASWSNANITIHNGLISGNTAGFGGGISARGNSTLTISNGEIIDNHAVHGGGVRIEHSTMVLQGGEIINNTAGLTTSGSGGGIGAVGSNITMHSGLISGNIAGVDGGGIALLNASIGTTSIFTMYGGEISDNHTVFDGPWNEGGGGVKLESYVTFNMHGGKIVDNSSVMFGGGVFVYNATFNMFDGAVVANNEGVWGGGVSLLTQTLFQLTNTASFTMNGGEISGNAANGLGGGVLVFATPGSAGSTFTMSGGTIGGDTPKEANTATNGGGVNIDGAGTFTMNGGKIMGNVATGSGGGIDFNGISPFTMNGGEISDNQATWGGGVMIRPNRTFNMNNGEISDNTASAQGGGLFVGSGAAGNGIFTMDNGEIDDNQATLGGGIFVNGIATINNGYITNNTATTNGGGIFAVNYANLTTSDIVTFSGNTAATAHDLSLHPDYPKTDIPAGNSGGGMGGNITNIDWATVSIQGAHALNNFDINYTGLADLQIVRFNPNGGTFTGTTQLPVRAVDRDGTYLAAFNADGHLVNPDLQRPTLAGHTFGGWFDTQENANGEAQDGRVLHTDNVTDVAERTLWARWTQNQTPQPPPSGGGNGGGTPPVVIEPDDPPLIFIADHIWYVRGFPEGDFRPGNSITRAEMSMILFRLLDSPNKYLPRTNNFSDVSTGWYAQAVSYLASRNIVTGYPDGTFRPNAPITRAELTAVMSRFFELQETGTISFADVSGSHWAIAYINNAVARGWVIGFEDDTFRPENATTRAEAVTMLNRVLVRRPNPTTVHYHLDGKQLFTDVFGSHWAFYDIMEAAIEHEYTLDEDGLEIWSSIYIPWLTVN